MGREYDLRLRECVEPVKASTVKRRIRPAYPSGKAQPTFSGILSTPTKSYGQSDCHDLLEMNGLF
ncbi:MAG TPA: hypothetical protein VFA15_09255 [Nitrososphaera sp.]|nr:hypothetical protein [Nitrososphaera sp.]